MTALVLAITGAFGVHLLYTALVLGWTGVRPGPGGGACLTTAARARRLLAAAGIGHVAPVELAVTTGLLATLGAGGAFVLFGGLVAPSAGAISGAAVPTLSARARRDRARTRAREAWPRMIEEIRIGTTTLGRSIPQALLVAAERAPEGMAPAFAAARREWLLSTDFSRTVGVLKAGLRDGTADTVCETLLVAHETGGTEVSRALTALGDDRLVDLHARKDARARQAGARFARRFVLVVPLGMAVVGLTIGDGRAAYQTAYGQLLVGLGLGLMALCWLWASRIMRVPDEHRVFVE